MAFGSTRRQIQYSRLLVTWHGKHLATDHVTSGVWFSSHPLPFNPGSSPNVTV